MLILMPSLMRLARQFELKIAQLVQQDVRTLAGAQSNLFGPQSWQFVNQLVNILNSHLFDLSHHNLNYQQVVRNPSTITGYTGGLKSLLTISLQLWQYLIVHRPNPYSTEDALQIIDDIKNIINSSQFPEPQASTIKPDLTVVLNNWSAILK